MMVWIFSSIVLALPHGVIPSPSQDVDPVVVFETSHGEFRVELWPRRAPGTVANFLELVRAGFYDEVLFHRVVRGFAIQTGLMDFDGRVKPTDTEPIRNEARSRFTNDRGTIAMARERDPHSATTEFFINLDNNTSLNHTDRTRRGYGFAVFGRVIDGMDVVDRIGRMPTRKLGPYDDFPEDPIGVYRAYVVGDVPGFGPSDGGPPFASISGESVDAAASASGPVVGGLLRGKDLAGS